MPTKRKYKSGAKKRDDQKKREFQVAASDRNQTRISFGKKPSSNVDSVIRILDDNSPESVLELENPDLIVCHPTGRCTFFNFKILTKKKNLSTLR